MNQEKFSKEIIKALDEKALDINITNRLTLARKKAMLSKKVDEKQIYANILVKIFNFRVLLSILLSFITISLVILFSSIYNNNEDNELKEQEIEILTDENHVNFWLKSKFNNLDELYLTP